MYKLLFIYNLLFSLLLHSCSKIGGDDKTTGKDLPTVVIDTSRNVVLNDFEIGAYIPYWGLADYQTYNYKSIHTLYMIATISRATVQEAKGLIWGDNDDSPNAYQQPNLSAMLSYIRSENPDIKILLALSDLHGDDTERAQTASLFTDTNRPNTINYVMTEYIDKYDFDGLDIDFEDSSLDPGYIYMNYPLLIRDFSIALRDINSRGRRKLCTATLSGSDHTRPIITSDFIDNVDLVGVQDYGSEKMDHIIANPYRNLKTNATGWATKMPKSKLSLGLAAWSIYVDNNGSFADGFAFNYTDQLKQRPDALWYLPYLTTDFHVPAGKPFAMQRYNGLYETQRKAEYSKDNGFRGVFMWEITKDTKDSGYKDYSLLSMLKDWHDNRSNYPKIVGYTTLDYYSNTTIQTGFHSIPASDSNWVGVYNFTTGASAGYYQYLPNAATGTVTIPSSLTTLLSANQLYILRFYGGYGGYGHVFHGTSNPFYKL